MKEQAGGENSHQKEVASSSGQKPRTAATSAETNFGEYEDNEWDVGIGNLIDDLDADIEKSAAEVSDGNNLEEVSGMPASDTGLSSSGATRGGKLPPTNSPVVASPNVQHSATVEKGLKMKIKRTKPASGSRSAEKHEIVKPVDPESNGKRSQAPVGVRKDKDKDVNSSEVIVKSENQDFAANDVWGCSSAALSNQASSNAGSGPTPKKKPKLEQDSEVDASSSESSPSVPEPRATSDACVGTSVGTVTEPDCLGPCEPGTSVILEGIVWQETDTAPRSYFAEESFRNTIQVYSSHRHFFWPLKTLQCSCRVSQAVCNGLPRGLMFAPGQQKTKN
ncbi:unnamed protein product [Notodromas monacha]|uniref:Zinc finger protein 609 n=1 Tax=Notodromas monacha TaxID=399045 RepID=A0A7R9G9E4_9CRUS|nr:unnamed protein product [Notodromas monacha]CAG0912547.1 unnamed protein product [Notodromas monacha]